MNEKLVVLNRGTYGNEAAVEVSHFGSVAIIEGGGRVLFRLGDIEAYAHLRSTAKPFQLAPFLIRQLDVKYRLEDAEIALLMSSHAGEPEQVAKIAAILAKLEIAPEELMCGIHAPTHEPTRRALICSGDKPNVLHNNCSGKHAAMIATAKHEGWDARSYLDMQHPLQKEIASLLCQLGEVDDAQLGVGVDGCSAPTFIMPLKTIARLYAALAQPNGAHSEVLRKLFYVGANNPYMIAGTKRLDTLLMQACRGNLFAKTGADGVYAMALAPNEKFPQGLGIAFKVSDGDTTNRARSVVATEILTQLGILTDASSIYERTLKNARGLDVGEIRATFNLK